MPQATRLLLTIPVFFNSSVTTDNGNIKGGSEKAMVFILLYEFAHSNVVPGFRSDGKDSEAGRLNNIDIENNAEKRLKS